MKPICRLLAGVFLAGIAMPAAAEYPIRPVPFSAVNLADGFWAPRLETNRTVTIPFALKMNEETGRVDNFRKAARLLSGPHLGKRYNDSDVYKAMEAAAYSLSLREDPALKKQLAALVDLVVAAQESDGYLYTGRTIDPTHPAAGAGAERWSLLRVSHELYCVGHMYEAAVAYFQATGERDLLAVALKNAELLLRTFGPDKIRAFPGHQEIEIGLAKLFRVSDDRRYLDLARFFLDQRGRNLPLHAFPPDSPFIVYNQREYMQDHLPVLEQTEAAGHAVRAAYMYAGMADVAALAGYPEYAEAGNRLWENVIGKKIYLTGGIGSCSETEGFGGDYELPNDAYAETCAAVGNALWNQRLFLLHGDGRYIDVLERIVYNGLLAGVSFSGDRFFYQNPLESRGYYSRSPWFEVACCPANVARFLPSLPGYFYATVAKGDRLFVNLFAASSARIDLDGREISVRQETRYPWEGRVRITVSPEIPFTFTLAVRIPGWSRNQPLPGSLYRYVDDLSGRTLLKVNDRPFPLVLEKGYALIHRLWKSNDRLEIDLPLDVRRVVCRGEVRENRGRVALERGPLVYCLEGADNGGRVFDLRICDADELQTEDRPDFLNGVVVIRGGAFRSGRENGKVIFTAIPYYAWNHRGEGEMAVWLPRLFK